MYANLLKNRSLGGIIKFGEKTWKNEDFSVRLFSPHLTSRFFHAHNQFNVVKPFKCIKAYMCKNGVRGLHTTNPAYGIVGFKLADIGEGIAEVELIKWFKNVGDIVEEMENVCTVQSDKAAVDISSRYGGTITKLYYNKGDIIKIGAKLMDIDAEGEEDEVSEKTSEQRISSSTSSTSSSSTSSSSSSSTSSSDDQVKQNEAYKGAENRGVVNEGAIIASPACRRLAKELNVNLRTVKGTGKDGRVLKEDIENFAKQSKSAVSDYSATSSTAFSSSSFSSPLPSVYSPSSINIPLYVPLPNVEVPIKGFSRAMVKMMNESVKIPHLNIGEEFDITNLVNARNKLKDVVMKEYGISLTFTSLIVKSVSLCLNKIPILNSKIDSSGTKYIQYGSHNISIAIDTPNGLVVPNIKNVQNLSILQIQSELLRLQKLANSNNLSQNDLTGGTISVSNVGVIAGTYVKALLFDGQAMIMGIGRSQKLPRFDHEGKICERHILNCAFSADHRHCDGATVARYTAEMRKYLENPELMLLHMH